MKKHSFKDWMIAVRPWSFPASTMPVLVTLAYLYWMRQDINWVNGIWALLDIIVFHFAGNTWSDYFDYKHKVDAKDTFGAKTLTEGMFTPREIAGLSLGLLCVALVAGLGLMMRSGFSLLYIGFGGVACALFYPALKFRALGDVVILFAYSLLPALGTSFVATGTFRLESLWIAFPVGLITIGILHSNNTRDIRTDGRAGIQTFAMTLGGKASVRLYCFEVLFPFAWVAACVAAGVFPWLTLLVFPALLPAWGNVRMALRFFDGGESAIAHLDQHTAKLQLLFSLLFTLSFALAGFFS